jgi:hypothetical protein
MSRGTVTFAHELLQVPKVLSEEMNVTVALRDQINQTPEKKIAFRAEPLHLALIEYPLIA